MRLMPLMPEHRGCQRRHSMKPELQTMKQIPTGALTLIPAPVRARVQLPVAFFQPLREDQ